MKSLAFQKKMLLCCFLLIPMLLMLAFVVYPAFDMVRISFTNWNGSSSQYGYIGLSNYEKALFHSPDVWLSLKNNLLYLVVSLIFVPVEIVLSVWMNAKFRGMNIFKSIVFLPYIINGVAISYMFSFFFSPENGGLNGILSLLGMDWAIQNWLSDVTIVNFSLASVFIWRNVGFFVVLFISGLQTISEDMLEAATIDGATESEKFIYIIVPNLKRTIEIVLFMNITWCLQIFDIPFIMTSGGPGHASSTFSTYAIETAFTYNNFGLANAMSIILVCIMIFVLILQKKLMNGRK